MNWREAICGERKSRAVQERFKGVIERVSNKIQERYGLEKQNSSP